MNIEEFAKAMKKRVDSFEQQVKTCGYPCTLIYEGISTEEGWINEFFDSIKYELEYPDEEDSDD